MVTVCRWGREVVVWGAEAGGAEGGVAGWCAGLFPLLRVVRVRLVVLLCCGPSWAYGPSTCDVDVGVVCQGLAPPDGGDPDMRALGVFAGSPEYEVYDGLMEAVSWGGQVRRALTVSLIQSSCRRYQPRGVVRALSWRVARRRSGSRLVAGVRGGCPGSGGGRAGWVSGVLRVYVDVWLALVGLGWAGWCRVASWVRDGLWGAVVVSWTLANRDVGRVRGAEWVSRVLGHARHGNG